MITSLVLLLGMVGCSDLAVFVPARDETMKEIEAVTLNADGNFEFTFSRWALKKNETYDLYVQKLDEAPDSLSLAGNAMETSGALSFKKFEVSAKLAPDTKVDAPSLTFSGGEPVILKQEIDPNAYYAFQVRKRGKATTKSPKASVFVAKASFALPESYATKPSEAALRIEWAAVPDALEYEIYSDKDATQLVGRTSVPFFEIPSDINIVPSELWIRSKRGSFIAKDLARAEVKFSQVKMLSMQLPEAVYTSGLSAPFVMKFDGKVVVESGSVLVIDNSGRKAVYTSGSGTSTLTFNYVVAAGEESFPLRPESTLKLKDEMGFPVSIELVDPANAMLLIDSLAPTLPTNVVFASGFSSNGVASVTLNPSVDENLKTHQVKLCSSNDCSTSCTPVVNSLTSPATISGVSDGVYYACVRGEDVVFHVSDWKASSSTITMASGPAAVVSVTSAKADGSYTVGETIAIQLNFSRAVSVTNAGDLILTLETGAIDRNATYVSGSGTSTLVFNYTVQAGDISSDLNYVSTSSLGLGAAGIIKDVLGDNANLTLPALGGASSLAGSKALVIDTEGPTSTAVALNSSAVYTNSTSVSLQLFATSAQDMYITNTAGCSAAGFWETFSPSKAWTLVQTNATATVYAKFRDYLGNESACINTTIVHDSVAPASHSVSIDAGATSTASSSVALTLAATDLHAIEMYVTNTAGCAAGGAWETFSASKAWSLVQSNATATVYAKFKDAAGNESSCVNDTIVHDNSAPSGTSISINAAAVNTNDANVTLTLAATDAGAIEMYVTNTAACSADGTWESFAASKAWTLGQTNGTATVYVKFRDNHGAESACINDTIVHDNLAPSSHSIVINSGAAYTNSTAATLTLAATDVHAMEMYITNTSGCGSGGTWETFAASKAWSLGQTNGTANVYGKFRDALGNESSCVNTTIVHDNVAPSSHSVSIDAGATSTASTSVTLTLAATDLHAIEMYVTNTSGCTADGTWESFAASKAWTLGQTNATATVYVKFRDAAGNVSTCVNDTIIHDDAAPTATSISINAAAVYANTTSVTLTLAAADAASIQMYVTNTATCTADGSWEAFAASKAWTLGQTNGTATVYVKFRDANGNESACINDTIIHDNVAPSSHSVVIDSGATYTTTTAATLTLVATDLYAMEMYVTNTAGCGSGGSYEAYSTSKSWTLSTSNATNTVYVKFKDAAGNESSCVNDTIIHDNIAPSSHSVSINSAAAVATTTAVTLTLAATDTNPKEMYITNTSGCSADGTWETYATSKAWTLAQTNTTATVYVKFRDGALNESTCVNDTIIHSDTAPTSPSISVNAAAANTSSPLVTLTLSATHTNPVEMYITNIAGCAMGGVWETYATSKSWTLAPTAALVGTVYVKFRSPGLFETTCVNDGINVVTTNSITNGGFETGSLSGWTESTVGRWSVGATRRTGSWAAYTNTTADNETNCISQTVDLTSATTDYMVSFYWSYGTEHWDDGARFEIDGVSQVTAAGTGTWEYQKFRVVKGASRTLRWCYYRDSWIGANGNFVRLDDVRVEPLLQLQVPAVSTIPYNTIARIIATPPSSPVAGYMFITGAAPATFAPVNGTSYSGSTTVDGNYIAYKGPGSTINFGGYTNGSTRYFTIYTYNDNNEYSLPTVITSVPEPLNAPYAVYANKGYNQVLASWSIYPGGTETHYMLVRNQGSPVTFTPTNGASYSVGAVTGGTIVSIATTATTSVLDTGLSTGQSYYYKVFAVGAGNTYSSTGTVASTAALGSCTGWSYNGSCWYMGAYNQTCNTVCAQKDGLVNPGKLDIERNADNCGHIMNNLGQPGAGTTWTFGTAPNSCSVLPDGNWMWHGGAGENQYYAKKDSAFACPCY